MGKALKDRVEICGIIVAIIAAISGFLYWAGEPPYANERETALKFLGHELQYTEQKREGIVRRIFEIEMEKARMLKLHQGFPIFMQQELKRLQMKEEMEKKKIEILIERGRNGVGK